MRKLLLYYSQIEYLYFLFSNITKWFSDSWLFIGIA